MEQQQPEGNWTLEDIKGALIDDMKAMMQKELRQPLAGLMPLLAPATAIPPAAVALVANPPVVASVQLRLVSVYFASLLSCHPLGLP